MAKETPKPGMSINEGRIRLFNVVSKNLKHSNYKRVTDKAELYAKLITGENMDSLLKKFTMRESEDLFKQRKDITQHIITGVCKNLMDVHYKLPRSTSVQRVIKYKDDSENKNAAELEDILKVFWGKEGSFDAWFATRDIELNYMDPNAFISFGWSDNIDKTKERYRPYPIEYSSKESIDFKYVNNNLEYLIVKKKIKVVTGRDEKKEEKEGSKYIMYLPNESIVLAQVFDEEIIKDIIETKKEEDTSKWRSSDDNNKFYVKIGKDVFEYNEPIPYNIGWVPAFRVGYVRDLYTNGETYLNPFDAAIPLMMKTIKTNSELDLTMSLLAFARLIQYAPKCSNKDCIEGKLRDSGKTCPDCNGLGFQVSKSAQEALYLKLPKDKGDVMDLSKLAVYLRPPVDIVEFQDGYIDKLTKKCYKVLYGSEQILKESIQVTATENQFDYDKTYDALFPYSVSVSKKWKFGVETIATIVDLINDLICYKTYGKDFKLKTKTDYINDRKLAKDSGVPANILNYYDNEIMRLNYIDNPEDFKRWEIRQSFNPFRGKSDQEILVLLSSELTTLYNKILYTHLDVIFEDIELSTEGKGFYQKERSKQIEMIKTEVNKIINEIEAKKG